MWYPSVSVHHHGLTNHSKLRRFISTHLLRVDWAENDKTQLGASSAPCSSIWVHSWARLGDATLFLHMSHALKGGSRVGVLSAFL